MSPPKFLPPGPLTVAVACSIKTLREGLLLTPSEADLIEVRLDAPELAPTAERLAECAAAGKPLLFTARHPDEGAFSPLAAEQRIAFLRACLPLATLVDVELRSADSHDALIQEAKTAGVTVVISHHDFTTTPSESSLLTILKNACDLGADMVKIACHCALPGDLHRLLGVFLSHQSGTPLAFMGMGPLGPISRLLFARLGSRLNYGAIGPAQVPGQWPAPVLKARITELLQNNPSGRDSDPK